MLIIKTEEGVEESKKCTANGVANGVGFVSYTEPLRDSVCLIESLVTDEQVKFTQHQPIIRVHLIKVSV